jgi:hypothetical protein
MKTLKTILAFSFLKKVPRRDKTIVLLHNETIDIFGTNKATDPPQGCKGQSY